MSMTDELRLLLDERDVKWSAGDILNDCYTEWSTDKHTCTALEINGRLSYCVGNVTVTEAVEATLGRGKCEIEINGEDGDFDYRCKNCGEAFSTWSSPNYCPGCGRRVMDKDDSNGRADRQL